MPKPHRTIILVHNHPSSDPSPSQSETGVPDEAFHAARAFFEEKELVNLTIAISLMNANNRMAISFQNTPQAAF